MPGRWHSNLPWREKSQPAHLPRGCQLRTGNRGHLRHRDSIRTLDKAAPRVQLSFPLLSLMYEGQVNLQQGFPGGSAVKRPPVNVGDTDQTPGSGRSPGERNGKPLQYSCLENSTDRRAWWATVHGVAKSQTQLSNQDFNAQGALSSIIGSINLVNPQQSLGPTIMILNLHMKFK